jgi:4-amino-4-deoxy-L-arabinose transferase-like glycosyltransferase
VVIPARRLAAFLIVLATVVRLGVLAQQRSLWIDEARLALNVASRSYLQLFPPLDYDQAAPLGFLWLERLVVGLFGVTEASLRMVPLLAGVATVALVLALGRRLFGERVALVSALLCALSPSLISASTEAKQYGVEALMTCLVLLAGLRWLEEPLLGRRWASLLGLGFAGIWFAPSVVFALVAGLGAILMLRELDWRVRLRAGAQAVVCWGIPLAVAYVAVYGPSSSAPYLRRYWSSAFLTPWREGVLLDTAVAVRSVLWSPVFRDRFSDSSALGSVALIAGISLVLALTLALGVRRLMRDTPAPARALVLLAPALMILASIFGIYPISGRTTLFFVPVLTILLAAGVDEASRLAVRRPTAASILLTPALLLLLVTIGEFFDSDPREDVRPLIALLQKHRQPGEAVYIFAGAIPAWAFYTTNWRSPDLERLGYLRTIASSGGPAFENAPSAVRRSEGEPETLVYRGPGGTELYGYSTGLEAGVFRFTKSRPDSGWSESETRRIRAVATPGVWLLFAHFHGPEGELLREIEAVGGRSTFEDKRNGAALVHYDFAS